MIYSAARRSSYIAAVLPGTFARYTSGEKFCPAETAGGIWANKAIVFNYAIINMIKRSLPFGNSAARFFAVTTNIIGRSSAYVRRCARLFSSTYVMQFEVEAAGVADGLAAVVSSPERGVVGLAVCALHPRPPHARL